MRDVAYEAAKDALFTEAEMAIAADAESARAILSMTYVAGQVDGARAALNSLKQYLDSGLTGQQAWQIAWDDLATVVGGVLGEPIDRSDIQ